MTTDGSYLYIIANGNLYKIKTTSGGGVETGYPKLLSTDTYEGLEYINSAGCLNSLYVVKRNITGNSFVKINPTTGASTVLYSLGFISAVSTDYSIISCALDYTTEIYYIMSSNGTSSNSSSFTTIDLTPTTPTTYAPITTIGASNHYVFGLQLKD